MSNKKDIKNYLAKINFRIRQSKMHTDGFTLLETLIVLLLTSMVVSLTFAYFNAFQKYMRQNITTSRYETDILRFESLIVYDFKRFNKVVVDEWDQLILGQDEAIVYKFNEKSIVRFQEGSTDTLKIKNLEYDYLYSEEYPNLLSVIKLNFNDLSGKNHQCYFYKEYPVKDRFNEFYERNFQ